MADWGAQSSSNFDHNLQSMEDFIIDSCYIISEFSVVDSLLFRVLSHLVSKTLG
ncbi:hypothetical protein ACSBR2_039532 [Camellia fascicularis]